jgi:DNA-binding beta-propeller fold protein YncE
MRHALIRLNRLVIFTKRRLVRQTTVVLALVGLAAMGSLHAQEGQYHFAREIPVGGEGGWDYLSVDPAAHRLYVSHATKVVVIDTQANKVAGEIPDTPGVHGFAIAADLGRGFSSNGRENKASIVDLKTLKLIQKVDTGENPDAIMYEPGRKEVYTMNGRGKSATVFDAQSGKVVATIPLEGKPEFAQADPKAGKVYVNIEDLNAIKVIDTATHKVTATWPIAPGETASGMAIDLDTHRLFIGCDNKLMLMVDNTNGKVIYSVPIGDGVDSNWFDPGPKLAFSSNGEAGTVTIAHEESPTLGKVVQTLKTKRGARTMALDPSTHNIYLAITDYEPQAAGTKERPKAVAGTFRVLVYQTGK